MFLRDRPDIVDQWYLKLDRVVGEVESVLRRKGGKQPRILILSDHGFTRFDYKVHINHWLIEKNYLVTENSVEIGKLKDIDWSRSQVYGVGLNSLYLNMKGREGRGIVQPEIVNSIIDKIRSELLTWKGPDGKSVISNIYTRDEVLTGPLVEFGPDIIVGYAPGYRASSQTGLGEWAASSIEQNRDHWGADHCIDASAVPGVIFCNEGLGNNPSPSFRDIPILTIDETLPSSGNAPPPSFSGEDQEILEERLKSLGYL
jgi:predicted AlkP superfamily phosphohydrolase/phosphomutase